MLADPPVAAPVAIDHAGLAVRAVKRADQAEPSAFSFAVERWKETVEAYAAIPDDDPDDLEDDLAKAADDAFTNVMLARAPDLPAIAEKAKLIIEELLGTSDNATADNPAYLSHLLHQGEASEVGLISLFQDAAMLCGAPTELGAAKADGFKADVWLADLFKKTGAVLSWSHSPAGLADHLAFDGMNEEEARAAFEALPAWHQGSVSGHLRRSTARARQSISHNEPAWVAPSDPANLIRVYAESAAWIAEQHDAAKRAVVRARLRESMRREVGLSVGVPNFDPAVFTAAAYAQGCWFRSANTLFGPEVMAMNGDQRSETRAITDLFCQLDSDNLAALASYLEAEMEWAASWVAQVETDTGCIVSTYATGIGFGLGPDNLSGRLEDAAAAFNVLTPEQRASLKACGQMREATGLPIRRMAQ